MSPKKRASKKAKKTARAKKLVRGKKLITKKKAAPKKKTAVKKKPAIRKKAGRKVGRAAVPLAAKNSGDQHQGASGLGDWSEETGMDQDRQTALFDDDLLAPDYGGSK